MFFCFFYISSHAEISPGDIYIYNPVNLANDFIHADEVKCIKSRDECLAFLTELRSADVYSTLV